MSANRLLTDEEVAVRRRRGAQMVALQEIEGAPFDAEELAMFAMFDRERWSDERCLAYVREWVAAKIAASGAIAAE